MKFTDNDLAVLKKDIYAWAPEWRIPILNLIARLEMAEKARKAWYDHVHDFQENNLISQRLAYDADDAWKFSCGQ